MMSREITRISWIEALIAPEALAFVKQAAEDQRRFVDLLLNPPAPRSLCSALKKRISSCSAFRERAVSS
jgi:hypothetical protein